MPLKLTRAGMGFGLGTIAAMLCGHLLFWLAAGLAAALALDAALQQDPDETALYAAALPAGRRWLLRAALRTMPVILPARSGPLALHHCR